MEAHIDIQGSCDISTNSLSANGNQLNIILYRKYNHKLRNLTCWKGEYLIVT